MALIITLRFFAYESVIASDSAARYNSSETGNLERKPHVILRPIVIPRNNFTTMSSSWNSHHTAHLGHLMSYEHFSHNFHLNAAYSMEFDSFATVFELPNE